MLEPSPPTPDAAEIACDGVRLNRRGQPCDNRDFCDTGGNLMARKSATLGGGATWPDQYPGPPVTRAEAEEAFGAPIPESAWDEIEAAFRWHHRRLNEGGTALNANRNDDNGWATKKRKATQSLAGALVALDRHFFAEVADLAELQSGHGANYDGWGGRLERAKDDILWLTQILHGVTPLERRVPSEAESRALLARDVFAALRDCGAMLSNGWKISHENNPNEADLTGFERLAGLLEIHISNSPAATSKWLREAMAQKE